MQLTDWIAQFSGPDGRFELANLRPDLPHALVARAEGFGSVVFELPPTELGLPVIELGDVPLPPGCLLRGEVVDELGQGLSDLEVTLRGWNADRTRWNERIQEDLDYYVGDRGGRTDDRGRFGFAGLAPGEYSVEAVHPGQRQGARQAFSIAPGEELETPRAGRKPLDSRARHRPRGSPARRRLDQRRARARRRLGGRHLDRRRGTLRAGRAPGRDLSPRALAARARSGDPRRAHVRGAGGGAGRPNGPRDRARAGGLAACSTPRAVRSGTPWCRPGPRSEQWATTEEDGRFHVRVQAGAGCDLIVRPQHPPGGSLEGSGRRFETDLDESHWARLSGVLGGGAEIVVSLP